MVWFKNFLTFLVFRYLEESKPTGAELENLEKTRAEQSLFIQEVLLATLTDTNTSLPETMADSEQLLGASGGDIAGDMQALELGKETHDASVTQPTQFDDTLD